MKVVLLLCSVVCFLGQLTCFAEAEYNLTDIWDENIHHQTKLNLIWDEIVAQSGQSNKWPPLPEFIRRFLFLEDDFRELQSARTFRTDPQKAKVLHTFASVAKVRFRFNRQANARYTGLFTEPSLDGIMTASTGNRIASNQTLQFGWGFKFFRTNSASSNILTLNSLSGELVWNMFGQMTCNHNSLSESFILLPHSKGWTAFPGQNGLSNLARTTIDGEEVVQPSFPYALCFAPAPRVQAKLQSSAKPFVHSYEQLHSVPADEHLLDIWAITHPKVLEDPASLRRFAVHVGEVWSVTKFMKSLFVDQRLFFQHQPFEEDLGYRPDWVPFMTPLNLMNEGALYAYRSLFEREAPNFEALQYTLSSLSRAAFNIFTDPIVRRNFIVSDLGVGRNAQYLASWLLNLPMLSEETKEWKDALDLEPKVNFTDDQLLGLSVVLFEKLSSASDSGIIPEWLLSGHSFPAFRYFDQAEQVAMWVRLISQLKEQ